MNEKPLETLMDIRDALCELHSQYQFLSASLILKCKEVERGDPWNLEGAVLFLEFLGSEGLKMLNAFDECIAKWSGEELNSSIPESGP